MWQPFTIMDQSLNSNTSIDQSLNIIRQSSKLMENKRDIVKYSLGSSTCMEWSLHVWPVDAFLRKRMHPAMPVESRNVLQQAHNQNVAAMYFWLKTWSNLKQMDKYKYAKS